MGRIYCIELSLEPDLNQWPMDSYYSNYSPPLYQLRHEGTENRDQLRCAKSYAEHQGDWNIDIVAYLRDGHKK